MGQLKLLDIQQLRYPNKREFLAFAEKFPFLEGFMSFRSNSPIEGALSFQTCWCLNQLVREMLLNIPDLSYVAVYYDDKNKESFLYEGDLSDALDVIICYRI